MAKFTITLTSGDVLDIDAPDEISDETLIMEAKKQLRDGESIASIAEVVVPTTPETTPFKIVDGEIIKQTEGERAHTDMMSDIARVRDSVNVADKYGSLLENPISDMALTMLAPSSHASMRENKMPDWGDIAIDVGSMGLAWAPPLRGASMLGTVAKNAGIQGALSGVTEGVLSAKHDQPYNLLAPVLGTAGGAGVGALKGKALSEIGKIVPPESIPFVDQNLRLTRASTASRLARKARGKISDIAIAHVSPDAAAAVGKHTIAIRGQTGMEFADEVRKMVTADVQHKLLTNAIDDAHARKMLSNLDDFESGVIEYAQHNPDSKVSIDNMLTLAQRMYKLDPMIGTSIINALEPHINQIRRGAAQMEHTLLNKHGGSVKLPAVSPLVADIRAAQTYSATPKAISSFYDLASDAATSPEMINLATRVAKPTTTRLANVYPVAISTKTMDPDGNPIYAPRGRITWEQLYSDAPKKPKP